MFLSQTSTSLLPLRCLLVGGPSHILLEKASPSSLCIPLPVLSFSTALSFTWRIMYLSVYLLAASLPPYQLLHGGHCVLLTALSSVPLSGPCIWQAWNEYLVHKYQWFCPQDWLDRLLCPCCPLLLTPLAVHHALVEGLVSLKYNFELDMTVETIKQTKNCNRCVLATKLSPKTLKNFGGFGLSLSF